MSHTSDEDNSSFTDNLSDLGPFTYIPSLTNIDEEDKMVEEHFKHDMLGEFPMSLSHKLLDVATEDIKQSVAIRHALKRI